MFKDFFAWLEINSKSMNLGKFYETAAEITDQAGLTSWQPLSLYYLLFPVWYEQWKKFHIYRLKAASVCLVQFCLGLSAVIWQTKYED